MIDAELAHFYQLPQLFEIFKLKNPKHSLMLFNQAFYTDLHTYFFSLECNTPQQLISFTERKVLILKMHQIYCVVKLSLSASHIHMSIYVIHAFNSTSIVCPAALIKWMKMAFIKIKKAE